MCLGRDFCSILRAWLSDNHKSNQICAFNFGYIPFHGVKGENRMPPPSQNERYLCHTPGLLKWVCREKALLKWAYREKIPIPTHYVQLKVSTSTCLPLKNKLV